LCTTKNKDSPINLDQLKTFGALQWKHKMFVEVLHFYPTKHDETSYKYPLILLFENFKIFNMATVAIKTKIQNFLSLHVK